MSCGIEETANKVSYWSLLEEEFTTITLSKIAVIAKEKAWASEVECFGGKIKRGSTYPNGQVHTVESEQFANALMIFYKKVKPANFNGIDDKGDFKMDDRDKLVVSTTIGYDVLLPDKGAMHP
eukprot:6641187-Ditylum_brightwellii.AAC.1